jgi:hypothetical protein
LRSAKKRRRLLRVKAGALIDVIPGIRTCRLRLQNAGKHMGAIGLDPYSAYCSSRTRKYKGAKIPFSLKRPVFRSRPPWERRSLCVPFRPGLHPARTIQDGQPWIFGEHWITLREGTSIELRPAIGANDLHIHARRAETWVGTWVRGQIRSAAFIPHD